MNDSIEEDLELEDEVELDVSHISWAGPEGDGDSILVGESSSGVDYG